MENAFSPRACAFPDPSLRTRFAETTRRCPGPSLLLNGVIGRFHLLKPALAAVLAFVGGKMLLLDVVKVPIGVPLGAVAALIALGVAASLLFPRRLADRSA